MTINACSVFQFLRGALRGFYGTEDLRNHRFLLVGMSNTGVGLLKRLCVDGVEVLFQDSSIKRHASCFAVCQTVDVYKGQDVDVVIDLESGFVTVDTKAFPLAKIGKDPYVQGIHEFYL